MLHSLVIGATGRTGLEFTRQALASGQRVTALVRSPEKMTINDQHLHLITGDGLDADAVAQAVSAHAYTAIVQLTGGGLTTTDLNTRITRHLMQAIRAHNSSAQLWILSAAGTGGSHHQLPFFGRLLKKTMLRAPFADHEVQEEEVMASGLPYVIVRPVGLTDGPLTEGQYLALENQPAPSSQISRANVAHYIVQHLGREEVNGKAIVLAHN